MKKIFINKKDDTAKIVERILTEGDRDIVLVVPRFSELASSVSNFHLLKREALSDDKNLVVESVDDEALAMAQAAQIPSLNPFLSSKLSGRHNMSDIIPPESETAEPDSTKPESDYDNLDLPPSETDNDEAVWEAPEPIPSSSSHSRFRSSYRLPRPRRLTVIKWSLAAVLLLSVAFVTVGFINPSAKIALVLVEQSLNIDSPIQVRTDTKNLNPDKRILAGEIFTKEQNLTLAFPASGEKTVERKARGRVTIYNAYSSDPQPLVATTRLLTPDGKLFRLVNAITVPGATVIAGQITPSSVEAEVVSDRVGEEYNIGPVSRFSIPGFQGSSKYEGFYAVSTEPMTGGFVGTVSYPTDADIESAKTSLKETLESSLNSLALEYIPDEFIVLNDATRSQINTVEIDPVTDENGQFSAFGSGSITAFSFRDSQLRELFAAEAAATIGFPVLVRDFTIDPVVTIFDLKNGIMEFTPSAAVKVVRNMDNAHLKSNLTGKNTSDLNGFLSQIDGVASASISLWPFWLKTTPTDIKNITITTQ